MTVIKRGLDVPISGEPEQRIEPGPRVNRVGLIGDDYIGMKPTMLVAEGDSVLLGQPVMEDKKNPGVIFTAPAAGTVVAVNRGPKRKFESVVIAATGDDKANLVVSLLAKTEFAVPRVVARVNRAENEWLFTEQWGVDVAVSKPRVMAALVEEAVTVGDLVRLMTFRQGEANLVEITLPSAAPYVGEPLHAIPLPRDCALVAILRGKRVLVPTPDDPIEAGDELIFVCTAEAEDAVRTVILGADSVERTRSQH